MLWILQFLLGLLKIIGIVLLTMICIVLLLVLLILFGAIRYKVEGSAKNRESTGQVLLETLHVNAKVSWLNPLFRVFLKEVPFSESAAMSFWLFCKTEILRI